MKPGDLSAAALRTAAAIADIEAAVEQIGSDGLPANQLGAIAVAHNVQIAPATDNAAQELAADSRVLLPRVDLSACKIIQMRPTARRSSRKRRDSAAGPLGKLLDLLAKEAAPK
jgi:hypothetical protein